MATIDTIRKILGDNLSIEPEQIEEDTTLDSIDIASLDLVELICDIEDADGIDFGAVSYTHLDVYKRQHLRYRSDPRKEELRGDRR